MKLFFQLLSQLPLRSSDILNLKVKQNYNEEEDEDVNIIDIKSKKIYSTAKKNDKFVWFTEMDDLWWTEVAKEYKDDEFLSAYIKQKKVSNRQFSDDIKDIFGWSD